MKPMPEAVGIAVQPEPKKPLGTLVRVDLRAHWTDEARDFTPWLADEANLKLLSDAVGFDLELAETEVRVGIFKADIVTRQVGTDDYVLIENQLGRTDHDHLGKLITYAAGVNAKAVVWVARELCDEHRRALDWLNESTDESLGFFGIEVELWRIGDSPPAPKFNVVCQPNEWAKQMKPRGELTETKASHLDFWRGFVDYCNDTGTTLSLRRPPAKHWFRIAIGRAGFSLSLSRNTQQRRIGPSLVIQHPRAKVAFAALMHDRATVEAELGAALEWRELPNARRSRIMQLRSADADDREKWPEMFAWLKERGEAFRRVFGPRVKTLRLEDSGAAEGEE